MSKTSNHMLLFLGWRPMEDRVGPVVHAIEAFLWGDARARHTFLIASTAEHPLVLIEIDVGDRKKGICKNMSLHVAQLNEIPKTFSKIEFIGKIQSETALQDLIQSAYIYVSNYSNYHVLRNNCRTFVEHLINQMLPNFFTGLPRINGSVLEYYHEKAKHDHPGLLIKLQTIFSALQRLY